LGVKCAILEVSRLVEDVLVDRDGLPFRERQHVATGEIGGKARIQLLCDVDVELRQDLTAEPPPGRAWGQGRPLLMARGLTER
jgi:hypothetical protein